MRRPGGGDSGVDLSGPAARLGIVGDPDETEPPDDPERLEGFEEPELDRDRGCRSIATLNCLIKT